MTKESIFYKSGYKYQLEFIYLFTHDKLKDLIPGVEAGNPYVTLYKDGRLSIRNSYAWDGPSGPTIDTLNFMRGSLVHDALYQLIREGYLGPAAKDIADSLLKEICIQDGMSTIRANVVYWAVKNYGLSSTLPSAEKKVISAP